MCNIEDSAETLHPVFALRFFTCANVDGNSNQTARKADHSLRRSHMSEGTFLSDLAPSLYLHVGGGRVVRWCRDVLQFGL